jgi:hypothetical protein
MDYRREVSVILVLLRRQEEFESSASALGGSQERLVRQWVWYDKSNAAAITKPAHLP